MARTQNESTGNGAEGATATATVPTDAPGLEAGTSGATPGALTPEQQAAADAKKAARAARRSQRSYVVVPMPANMKSLFEDQAKTADKAIGPFVRDYLASQLGIEIPVTVSTRRVKYATDEERDAAKKARREDRSSTMKNLMAEFRKLTKGGMSPEQAVLAASQNVANGTPAPEAAVPAAPALEGAPA